MKVALLIIAAWAVTAAIALFGVSAGITMWFYMEPAMGSVANPASYTVSVFSGFAALVLSVAVSMGISIHLIRCNLAATARRESQAHPSPSA